MSVWVESLGGIIWAAGQKAQTLIADGGIVDREGCVHAAALSSTGPRPNDPQTTPDAVGPRAKEQHRDG